MELPPNPERHPDEYDYIREMCNSDLLNYIEFTYVSNREVYHKIKYIVCEELEKRQIDLSKA